MGKKDKRERKKAIIKKYLPNCSSTWDVYTYGNIPRSKIDSACRAYAGKVNYDDVFGLIDETVFGSGKKGFLFTPDGFYRDNRNKIAKYADGLSYESLSSGYNVTVMNEMLEKLYEIENEPSGWDIAGMLVGGAFDFLQALSEETSNAAEKNIEQPAIEDTNIVDGTMVELDSEEDDEELAENYLLSLEAAGERIDEDLLEEYISYLETMGSIIDELSEADVFSAERILKKIQEHAKIGKITEAGTIEELCDYLEKKFDIEANNIKDESSYNFGKTSIEFQRKMRYYLLKLKTCEDNEKEALLEECKTAANWYSVTLTFKMTNLQMIQLGMNLSE